jgi:hypothetical protein
MMRPVPNSLDKSTWASGAPSVRGTLGMLSPTLTILTFLMLSLNGLIQ